MFNVGGPEVLVILLVALIVLGPAQLPKVARQIGHAMGEIRRISSGFQRELADAFDTEEAKAKEKPKSPGGPEEHLPMTATEGPEQEAPADGDPSA